jgi:hypothetical protein
MVWGFSFLHQDFPKGDLIAENKRGLTPTGRCSTAKASPLFFDCDFYFPECIYYKYLHSENKRGLFRRGSAMR